MTETVKIGQYTTKEEGGFRFRYLVLKTMKKTAEISESISKDGSDFKFNLHSRYPLDLLSRQTSGAEFMEFKKRQGGHHDTKSK
ncbi:hypothetical protein LCGC14_1702230 [marine sediment metagenome]|uniref:Uncharacterized protein n=1 Tax=marine sediment metagenome TaxID=412755 RepID=A0A0F9KHN2_9ZZZZ